MGSMTGRRRPGHLAPVEEVDREPSAEELAEIEREWPLIAAELAVVDAETALAVSPTDVLAHRRHRRALRRVLAESRALANRSVCPPEVAA